MPSATVIDLNSDVGEGFDGDAAILAVVTSANVACGLHAGNPALMARTVTLAAGHGVAIGAHVSYPDREGFGRRDMEIESTALRDCVSDQLGTLAEIAHSEGAQLSYVKPHGALYNRIARDHVQASAVVQAIVAFARPLALLALPDSVAMAAAREAGLDAFAEGYADRAYTADGALVSRSKPGAVIDDERAVVERAIALAGGSAVHSIDGTPVRIAPRSICIHGDTPGAARLSARIRDGLLGAGVTLAAFSLR
jgi:UPF0271 protein